MTTIESSHDLCELPSAKESLAALIEQTFEIHVVRGHGRRALRLEVPTERVDALGWLLAQGNRSRGYWRNRECDFELAGIGRADTLTADAETDYDALFTRLRESIAEVHPNLRYFGGMRFSHHRLANEQWQPFGSYRFVLPRFEVLNQGDQCYLVCNIVLQGDEADLEREILAELDAMPFPGTPASAQRPQLTARTDTPDQAGWRDAVTTALHAQGDGTLDKVVLARETTLIAESGLDPIALLSLLVRDSSSAYHYCFQPTPDSAFIGMSPERLYRRQDRFLQSEALAGTRPRGATSEEDSALGTELKTSEKQLREHAYVTDSVRGIMEAYCHAVHTDPEPALLQLPRCQHLYTHVEGILAEHGNDADLLRAFHPTPAVGGTPRDAALDWIEKAETFDRGWYAGPVGWVGRDAAEFAVGIRAGLVHGKQLSLYAGAGIVDGSDPDDEWAEIENKMSTFLAILESDAD
jgi:menaquinone-specific isochorismate synthase